MVDIKQRPVSLDRRQLIPKAGLREYWYPAIAAHKVTARRPVGLRILSTELVFFRDTAGQVRCLWNVCPHRGGSLARGDCHFTGYISCPYHGWTYDGDGKLVAVLTEGPDSLMLGKVQARSYPTQTHKGIVFVWMGDGAPAPIEEDVPEEIFEPGTLVLSSAEEWDINWAVALENSLDAHPPYVHRDAWRVLLSPIPFNGPTGTPIVHGPRSVHFKAGTRSGPPLRGYFFPTLGWQWPRHHYRNLWTWLFAWAGRKRRQLPDFHKNPEWAGFGHHLPAMFRLDQKTDMYTRNCVPVDDGRSRMFYYYATRPTSRLQEWYKRAQWVLWHRWSFYVNFSKQDLWVMEPQRYDTPENLSPTDIEVVALRKMLTRGRGLPASPELTAAEARAEELTAEAESRKRAPR